MSRFVPFSVSRDDARTLLRQVEDGLRESIVGGVFRPGETLPSYRELAALLGVSQIITKTALRKLAEEGLVDSRPRIGSVVRDPGKRLWRGHVVFVYDDNDLGYFQTVLSESLRLHLNRAGYLFTRATVEADVHDRPLDFSNLDAALAHSVDLAIVLYNRPAVVRHLAERGIPCVAVSENLSGAGTAGLTGLDYAAALPGFIAACHRTGVRNVVQIAWHRGMCNALPALLDAGIAATGHLTRPDLSGGKLIGVEKAGYELFRRLAATGQLRADAVYLFTDDYLARGALLAMAHAGLDTPRDVRIATLFNKGLGPFHPRELSRMEVDPQASAAIVADAAIAFLRTGHYPENTVIGSVWHDGETMFPPSAVRGSPRRRNTTNPPPERP